MDALIQDLRFAFRSLRKHWGTTILATLCLALGIGANAAIYSVVRAVVLESLPYREPDRLFKITETYVLDGQRGTNGSVSPDNFRDLRKQSRAFDAMAAYRVGSADLGDVADPERLRGIRATANLFTLLGARPIAGRTFQAEDDDALATPVVVISEGLWRRRFGADPGLIGKQITLSGVKHTVVGIMPASFDFPVAPFRNDVWRVITTASLDATKGRGKRTLQVVGRLATGADSSRAAADFDQIMGRIARDFPEWQKDRGALAASLNGSIVGKVRPVMLLLLGAVGLVLLIACANVANLLLARAAGRRREAAIRMALGAGRLRLVRQLLTESVVLAVGGGMLGLTLAWWGLRVLVGLAASSLPRGGDVALNGNVLIFAIVISVTTGFLFGIIPALRVSATDLRDDLGGSDGRARRQNRHYRTLDALIVAEVALSLVLLVGCGLMLRGFASLLHVDPGFKPDGVLAFHASTPTGGADTARYEQFYGPVLARLRALPGVRGAAFTTALPIQDGLADQYFSIVGRPTESDPDQRPSGQVRVVSGDYFRTLGITVVAGREFTDGDGIATTPVAVINDELQRRFFASENPLGKQLNVGGRVPSTIVGVVRSVRQAGLDQAPSAEFYLAAPQVPSRLGATGFVLSTRGRPESYVQAVRDAVHAVAPHQPVYQIATMNAVVADSLATRKLVLMLLALFGAVALALSSAGIFGVMSFGVTQRTRELGIRLALGARAGEVTAMVLRDAARIVGIGVGVGLLAAGMLTGFLRAMLYGIGPHDPATFVVVSCVIVLTAFAASAMPAMRAARIDPLRAIRME